MPKSTTQSPFVVSIKEGFKEQFNFLVDSHLSKERIKAQGFFNPEYIKKLTSKGTDFIYSRQLLSMLMLQMWLKAHKIGDD